ncbi:hypothetical protein L484_012852 [Morus notabilis]|uniref:Uncharacterized protein n=1 Tax=Morus notabilis TaxID=981085 RepID=W9QV22_9ROSA|nr:hypothetical protein L484_012852 [Morus notabilis]
MPRLVYLNLDAAYDGEELHFENGGFRKLKEINLKNLKWLKVVKIDQGALSHLEKLEIGPSLEMKEVPTDIINLRKLKHLDIWEMPREFVAAMQPDGGEHFWKIKNVARVRFWRKDDAGDYVEYKLSSSNAEPPKPALSGSNPKPPKLWDRRHPYTPYGYSAAFPSPLVGVYTDKSDVNNFADY